VGGKATLLRIKRQSESSWGEGSYYRGSREETETEREDRKKGNGDLS